MKRLIIIASLAILAVGCQKTEIQNEVQTPIGFSTETGKMTRAIVNNTQFDVTQPFAVYAYGWHDQVANKDAQGNPVALMDNVEIISTNQNDLAAPWKTNDGFTYYWPNDPRTKLNFYAYSPAYVTDGTATDGHKKLTFVEGNGNGVTHNETVGMTLTNYVHENMYVDFMVATPVKGATYSDPDGDGSVNAQYGVVPMTFNHQMTQVLFNVTTDKAYPGVTFTVEKITLKNIINTATYTNTTLASAGTYANGTWDSQAATAITNSDTYVVFPAIEGAGAELKNAKNTTDDNTTAEDETKCEAPVAIKYETNATEVAAGMYTTPVTMIPQKMVKANLEKAPGEDNLRDEEQFQMFEVVYSVSGKGVASEQVVRNIPFYAIDATSVVDWGVNKKILYTVKIGLQEIQFTPSVAVWDDGDTVSPDTDSSDSNNPGGDYPLAQ